MFQNCAVLPVACGEFQWSCASKTQCIPRTWRCDGMKDCTDESDEMVCKCLHLLPDKQVICGVEQITFFIFL